MGNQPKLEWSQQREAKDRAESLRPWQVKEIKVRREHHIKVSDDCDMIVSFIHSTNRRGFIFILL